jgi:serine/threonine protein kinase
MEYVDGQNLSDVIRDEPMDLANALQLAIQIAGGLSAAHRAGVIHRDIKPENIMVVGQGKEVKLMDFGIARLRDSTATARLTQTGMIMGTPVYMAPEQIEGGELSERTDIYAFGVVLYEMFTGRVPFKATTPGAILVKHLHEVPIPLSKVRKEIPAALERIVAQALQKGPEKRQQSMDEVVEGLKKAQRDAEQLGIRGVRSFTPQMAAMRRGLSAVAAPFRNFLGKGSAETVPSRSTDRTNAADNLSGAETLGSDPRASPDSAMTDAAFAAPSSDALGSSDSTRFEPALVTQQSHQLEAQLDPSSISLEQSLPGPGGKKEEIHSDPASDSIAPTVAFTVPLQVPEPISKASAISTDIPEAGNVASIESEMPSAIVSASLPNVADLTDISLPLDSELAKVHEPLLTQEITRSVSLDYQATVAAGSTEINAPRSNETISVTSVLTQSPETGTPTSRNWFIGPIVSVFVIVLAFFGGMKLFNQNKPAPLESVRQTTKSDAPAGIGQQFPEQSEIPGGPTRDETSIQGPLSFPTPIIENTVKEPRAEKPKPQSFELGGKPSGSTTIRTIEKHDSPVARDKKSEKRNENAPVLQVKPVQPITDVDTKKTETASTKSIEPATDNRIAVLKPSEPPPQRIELKDLLIVSGKKELKVKERVILTVKGRYSDGKETDITSKVQWKSSDASIASINSRGELEALREGRAQITATYEGVASPNYVLNIKTAEEGRKPEEPADQIKDLRRRLLR